MAHNFPLLPLRRNAADGGNLAQNREDEALNIVEDHTEAAVPARPAPHNRNSILPSDGAIRADPPPRNERTSEIEAVVAAEPANSSGNVIVATAVEATEDAKCASCGESLPAQTEAVVLFGCRHTLCVRCAIRCVSDEEELSGNDQTSCLSSNPLCIVPNCNVPLADADVLECLAPSSVDNYIKPALSRFYDWVKTGEKRKSLATSNRFGPSYIQLREFIPGRTNPAVRADGNFERAYGVLWEWGEYFLDEQNARNERWACVACGEYVYVRHEETEANISGAIPARPLYPHCGKARACALMVAIAKLSKMREEYKRNPAGNPGSSSKRQRTHSGFTERPGYSAGGASEDVVYNCEEADEAMAHWLSMVRCYIVRTKGSSTENWPCYIRLLLLDCDMPSILSQILTSGSIMEVGPRAAVYLQALKLIEALNESPPLRLLVAEQGRDERSLAELVYSFLKQAALLSRSEERTALSTETKLVISQIGKSMRGILKYKLLPANHALAATNNSDSEPEARTDRNEVSEVDIMVAYIMDDEENLLEEEQKNKYIGTMKEMQFAYVRGLAEASTFREEAVEIRSRNVRQRGMERRITKQISDLSSELLVTLSSTIVVRVDEDDNDFLRACIFGPLGTPYDSGGFIFDIFLPPNFPFKAPMVRCITGGDGVEQLQLHPYINSSGKMLVSILMEDWSPAITLDQVLVSIQGLVLVREPFFDTIGEAEKKGTADGEMISKIYNMNIQQHTINHAMLDIIRNPLPELQIAIEMHFKMKRHGVEKLMARWMRERNDEREKLDLKVLVDDMKKELDKLED